MAIYVIGGAETSDLWEIDTEGGTVKPLGAEGIDKDSLAKIQTMRKNGFTVVKGVTFAVALTESADLTLRQLTDNGDLTARQLSENADVTSRQLTDNG